MKRFLLIITIAMIASSCCGNQSGNSDTAKIVLENIAARKSVRSYTAEPVPDEMIEQMLRAAMAAPSAKNVQPWEFVVIRERATLDTLASRLKYAKMLAGAPLAIIVCAQTENTHPDGSVSVNIFWEQDAAAATENLLLAAEALGLGAVWTAASDPERSAIVKDVIAMPHNVQPLCVIPIGFPASNEQPKDKWKPEKVHYEKW